MTSQSRRIALVAAIMACIGLADSGYLTIKHLQGSFIRCEDECSAVLSSRYADGIGGIPLAGFGAIAYAIVIIAAILAASGYEMGRRIFLGMAFVMALFSVWLIYLQAFVVHAFCKYCLASAAVCFMLACLALIDRIWGRNREAKLWK